MTQKPLRVVLIDLPDEAMDVLSDYSHSSEYEVLGVVGPDEDSQACRMAEMLQVAWYRDPGDLNLTQCDRVVVGPEGRLAEVRDRLTGTSVSVASLEPNGAGDGSEPQAEESLIDLLGGDPFKAQDETPALPETPKPKAKKEPKLKEEPISKTMSSSPSSAVSGLLGLASLTDGRSLSLRQDNPGLRSLLDGLIADTGARTASIMLPHDDGTTLGIAASVGLDEALVQNVRQKVGDGLAGEAFATGEVRTFEAEVPGFAEAEFGPRFRMSASVPVMADKKPIGVLSVNAESDGDVDMDSMVARVGEAAKTAYLTLLQAVDLRDLDPATLQEVLLSQIDRLMSGDRSLPERLDQVVEVLRGACGADDAALYLADSCGRRLTCATASAGVSSGNRHPDLDRGFLGWAMRHSQPLVLVATAAGVPERRANAYLPIHTAKPHALIVLENVPVDDILPDELRGLLGEVAEVLGEVMSVEEGMGHQDLLSNLKMRITDSCERTEDASPLEQTQSLLELGVELMAARCAVWVPDKASRPLTTPPSDEESRRMLAESWFVLDRLAEQARERRVLSWDMGEEIVADDAVKTNFPYVAIRDRNSDAVLMMFFSSEEMAPKEQLPLPAVFEVLFSLAQNMPKDADGIESRPQSRGHSDRIFDFDEMETQVSLEWRRSQRLAHSFVVTRFQTEDGDRESASSLRDFLRRNKRAIDLLAEDELGFVLLSPESGDHADELSERYRRAWHQVNPGIELSLAQTVFPRDGHAEDVYLTWMSGLRRTA